VQLNHSLQSNTLAQTAPTVFGLTSVWQSQQCGVCHDTFIVETLRSRDERLAAAIGTGTCPTCGELTTLIVAGTVRHIHRPSGCQD
jgi:hypothetical protein